MFTRLHIGVWFAMEQKNSKCSENLVSVALAPCSAFGEQSRFLASGALDNLVGEAILLILTCNNMVISNEQAEDIAVGLDILSVMYFSYNYRTLFPLALPKRPNRFG
jgi:hypothetical protein